MATPIERNAIEEEQVELTPEQRELVRSLEISWAQAEQGETRSVWEFLEELRREDEAEANASNADARV